MSGCRRTECGAELSKPLLGVKPVITPYRGWSKPPVEPVVLLPLILLVLLFFVLSILVLLVLLLVVLPVYLLPVLFSLFLFRVLIHFFRHQKSLLFLW